MKLKDFNILLDDLLLSDNFDVNWPLMLRKSNMIGPLGLHEVEYDDDDKPYHIIRIANSHAYDQEAPGTLIHELIHCEQAEKGLPSDHDDFFMKRVCQLRKIYSDYSIL